jgi:hypothetical protein
VRGSNCRIYSGVLLASKAPDSWRRLRSLGSCAGGCRTGDCPFFLCCLIRFQRIVDVNGTFSVVQRAMGWDWFISFWIYYWVCVFRGRHRAPVNRRLVEFHPFGFITLADLPLTLLRTSWYPENPRVGWL